MEESELRQVVSRIRGINALASLQSVQRSNVSVDYVLGVGGFDLAKVGDQVRQGGQWVVDADVGLVEGKAVCGVWNGVCLFDCMVCLLCSVV